MKFFQRVLALSYWLGLVILFFYGLAFKSTEGGSEFFHFFAYWVPAVAILAVISGQFDLLLSIRSVGKDGKKGEVNIKARMYDFIHWLMLIALNVGLWMIGGVTIGWLLLKLLLLSIIAWQIGVGLKNRWHLTTSDKLAGAIAGILALLLGSATAYIRHADPSKFGGGWGFETITSIVATMIVAYWISLDIGTIKARYQENASKYPRSFFMKGVFGNSLILLFWVHIMLGGGGFGDSSWWLRNVGLTVNVLIGNLLYLGYWLTYENVRHQQEGAHQISKSAM